MMFRDKSISKFYAYALAAVFALTLAGCGGGGGGSAMDMDDDDDMPMGTPQETCEGAGGRYNADDTCSSAEDLEAERIAAAVQAERERIEAIQAAAAATASALKAAQDAARIASVSAAASVTAAEAHKDLDLVTFVRAQIAAENAAAALAAALLATDPGAAEAAQADAEAAAEGAKKYADMILVIVQGIEENRLADAAEQERIRLGMVEANALQGAKDEAQAAYDAAAGALAAVDPYKDAELAAHTRATDALQAVSDANDAVQAATTSADAEGLIAAVEEARDVVTGFTAMVTAAKADADKAKTDADKMAADAKTAAKVKAAGNAEAMTKIMAINAEAAETTDTSAGNPSEVITVSVKYGAITVKDDDNNADDDPKFAGSGNEFTREMDDDVDVVVVHTDIEEPEGVAFAKFENAVGETPQALNSEEDGTAESDPDEAVAFDPGDALVSTVTADKAILDNMMSSAFAKASAESTSVTHNFNAVVAADSDADPPVKAKDAAEVEGTYNGAMGTYKCTGDTDCTVTVNGEGDLTAASNGWIFTPARGAKSDQPDYDYLTYGVWVNKTVKDGVTEYNSVETYATSSLPATTTVGGLIVDATYKGNAAGVYGHKTFMESGDADVISAGTFTAAVELNAYFGESPDVASSQHNSVQGMVSDFVLSGGQDNNWNLAIKSATGSIVDGDVVTASGTTDGGGVNPAGENNWNGAFHGAFTPNDGATTEVDESAGPPVLVGEFNGHFINGHTAGAFGSRLQKK